MVAGEPLFKDLLEVLMYSITAFPPHLAVEKVGFSPHCVSFLRDVLQPRPGDRPSAEVCLEKAWITSKDPGLEYSIGSGLYSRLSEIKLVSPRLEPLADLAINLIGAYGAPSRTPPA